MLAALALLSVVHAHGFPAVLVITDDDDDSDVEAFRQAVDDLGPHLELSWVDETNWDGSNPPLHPYVAVIHLNGVNGDKHMPEEGQQALDAFVADGGGFIHASFNAREHDEGDLAGLTELTLFTAGAAGEGDFTLNVVSGQESHPVLMEVPASVSLRGGYEVGEARSFSSNPSTTLMVDGSGAPALLVREVGLGRVVAFHHAANYGGYGLLDDPELQVLIRNAIWWSGRCDEDRDGQMVEVCGELDCDDGDEEIFYGAEEVCDGVDNDCDGVVDGESASDAGFWYLDGDGDGYGTPFSVIAGCEAPSGYVDNDGDCDDNNPAVQPGAAERFYDGVDQDCDGGSDYDFDGDGVDSASHGGEDCDDGDAQASPGGERDCAGADPNDADGDGVPASEDCDDHHSGAFPGAEEVWYDGVDQDCDGHDLDADGDGHDSADWGGDDCDDADPAVSPSADDVPYDGWVTDCDPSDEYDADGDGHDHADHGGADCDDSDPAVSPDAEEVWYDGVDQDCDGADDDRDGDGLLYAEDCDDRDPQVGRCAEDTGELSEDKGCGGCGSSGGGPGFVGLLLLAGLGLRRRG